MPMKQISWVPYSGYSFPDEPFAEPSAKGFS